MMRFDQAHHQVGAGGCTCRRVGVATTTCGAPLFALHFEPDESFSLPAQKRFKRGEHVDPVLLCQYHDFPDPDDDMWARLAKAGWPEVPPA